MTQINTEPLDLQAPSAAASHGDSAFITTAYIVLASVLVFVMHGYQFGHSNHTVYLLDALRHVHPTLFQNDWFATQTLQYHAAFGYLSRWLYRLGIIRPAFFIGYVALIAMFNIAALRITRSLGGSPAVFLLGVFLFYVSAAGTGLGMYQFFQDSAMLPSNVAAVAMLWGIAEWFDGHPIRCGIALGVAGLFHLNYALVVPPMWAILAFRRGRLPLPRAMFIASAAAILPSLLNIAFALPVALSRTGKMPLADFVDIYVRLRHPHHYDPSSWPAWLWIAFLWPLPFAIDACRRFHLRANPRAWRDFACLNTFFAALLIIALFGAGWTYLSESLIQASLYRFSVFVKLLTCLAAAFWFFDVFQIISTFNRRRWIAAVAPIGCAVLIAGCIMRGPYIGLFQLIHPSPAFDALAKWARNHTPTSAIFLTPPDEDDFRIAAERAIVVDFKAVPQISGELIEWRHRLQTVLDLPDLRKLPCGLPAASAAIHSRYARLTPRHLIEVARSYKARYVISAAPWPGCTPVHSEFHGGETWFLYDLQSLPAGEGEHRAARGAG